MAALLDSIAFVTFYHPFFSRNSFLLSCPAFRWLSHMIAHQSHLSWRVCYTTGGRAHAGASDSAGEGGAHGFGANGSQVMLMGHVLLPRDHALTWTLLGFQNGLACERIRLSHGFWYHLCPEVCSLIPTAPQSGRWVSFEIVAGMSQRVTFGFWDLTVLRGVDCPSGLKGVWSCLLTGSTQTPPPPISKRPQGCGAAPG